MNSVNLNLSPDEQTGKQMAAEFGIHRVTMDRWIAAGKIVPSRYVTYEVRVPVFDPPAKQAAAEWIEAHSNEKLHHIPDDAVMAGPTPMQRKKAANKRERQHGATAELEPASPHSPTITPIAHLELQDLPGTPGLPHDSGLKPPTEALPAAQGAPATDPVADFFASWEAQELPQSVVKMLRRMQIQMHNDGESPDGIAQALRNFAAEMRE